MTAEAPLDDLVGPALVLLVRHGATEWSTAGRHTGRTDVELTPDGVDQARRVGPLLGRLLEQRGATERPVVVTSPLRRARHTAELALPNLAAEVIDQIVEVDYGEYEGLTAAEIRARVPGWTLFTHGCPGGESLAAVGARCDSFVAKMERVASGRTVIAFTHGHLSRILTARMLGLPASAGATLHNDTATVAVLDHRRGDLVLTGWNIPG
jgi:probable phosphoglycerate mutase